MIRIAASTRLAFFLIAILVLLVVLSAVIPQKEIATGRIVDLQDRLGSGYRVIELLKLDEIYTAPYFFVLLGLLSVNLAAGNVRRFRIIYRTERTLLHARHLGSILFHLSLLVIVGAVILNYLYRFEGVFSLTEGQSETEAGYFRTFSGPLHSSESDRFQIALETFYEAYRVNGDSIEAAQIALSPASGQVPMAAVIWTSQPFLWNSMKFHMGARSGYSPELLVEDSAGQVLFRSFVRLATLKQNGEARYFDSVYVPGAGIEVAIEVRPAVSPEDPVRFDVRVHRDGNGLFSGSVSTAEAVTFDGLRLSVPRLRRWCYIAVVESPYLNLVFFGFWAALAGLTISLVPRIMRRERTAR